MSQPGLKSLCAAGERRPEVQQQLPGKQKPCLHQTAFGSLARSVTLGSSRESQPAPVRHRDEKPAAPQGSSFRSGPKSRSSSCLQVRRCQERPENRSQQRSLGGCPLLPTALPRTQLAPLFPWRQSWVSPEGGTYHSLIPAGCSPRCRHRPPPPSLLTPLLWVLNPG